MGITYGSVCSGIEAATTAWHPLGWSPQWFSEIEPFPSAVLAHHWPHVPNLGDFPKIRDRIAAGEVEAPDVLVGGTPCQAFSVAGLRKSMDDKRGQLTLEFVRLADALDSARSLRGQRPTIIVWENVPGVLNTPDNAFGCFLAGLVGEDDPLEPPGGRWTNAGYVRGPRRAVAWRILDAQYFGVAQRRRRVFVVAGSGGIRPEQVLFELDGVRRDSPPSRETGKGASLDASRSSAQRSHWDGGPHPSLNQSNNIGGQQPHVAVAFSSKDYGADAGEIAPTMRSMGHNESHANGGGQLAVAVGFNARQDPDSWEGLAPVAGTLAANGGGTTRPAGNCNELDFCVPVNGSHWDGGPHPSLNQSNNIGGVGMSNQEIFSQRGAYLVAAGNAEGSEGLPFLTCSNIGKTVNNNTPLMAFSDVAQPHGQVMVRRLTPTEAERLQGFPDGHTRIPWRGKPAEDCPDGPRYKALGNSMAVPVMRWIGARIARQLEVH